MDKKGQGYANTKRHNPCHVMFVYGEIPVAVFDLVVRMDLCNFVVYMIWCTYVLDIIAAVEEEDMTVAIEGMLPIVAASNEEE
ncbi:hypothetical protein YC2023_015957 [Brassica napus]